MKKNFDFYQIDKIRLGFVFGLTSEQIKVYAKPEFSWEQMGEILHSFNIGLPEKIVKQEIAKLELSPKEMAEISEELDKEFYELGREGLLEKYGIVSEKENSEIEKNENILDASEEISLP